MKKTKFDLLFEDIANKLNINVPSPYDETVEEYVHEYIRHDFKVVIVKVTDDTGTFFEFMLGKIDKDGNLIDWPYFESSNEFETIDKAINAAEDYIYDYEDEHSHENYNFDEDPDQRLPKEINDELL